MDVFEAITRRRSVKHFDPEATIPSEDLEQLIQATMLSPTSFNIQQWRFVVVQDPELRQEIRQASYDQAQVTESSLLVILAADLKAWQKSPERYWNQAPEEVSNYCVEKMQWFYGSSEQLQRDEAIRSCGIAAQTLMLAAVGLNYDTCPMIGFEPEKVAKLIQLPKDHILTLILAVGKMIQPAMPRSGQLPFAEVTVYDRFDSNQPSQAMTA